METINRLAGAPNFRDAGGYRTLHGGRVRTGRLYRSGQLSELTGADMALLDTLGLRLACDLRSAIERERQPSRWPGAAGTHWLELDTSADLRAGNTSLARILECDPTPQGVQRMMLETYRLLPRAFVPHLQLLFARLLDGEGLPVLVFCTAGKDRTGFMIAILLHVLNVPKETIHEDYLKTNALNQQFRVSAGTVKMLGKMTGKKPDQAMIDLLAGVQGAYLDMAFDTITRQYGSLQDYLEHACGLDPMRQRRLQDLLIE